MARLCADFPGRYWRDKDRARAYPQEFVEALSRAGCLSILIPEEYGGGGLGIDRGRAVLETINRSGGTGTPCTRRCTRWARSCGTATRSRSSAYLPRIASGSLRLQAFGVTEPDAGTDTTRIRTSAVRDGDHYVVNGEKVFTSRFQHSDLMLLLVRTTKHERREEDRRDRALLVDIREAVVKPDDQVRPRDDEPRDQPSCSSTTSIVPVDNLIGDEGKGFRYILSGMNAERILVASENLGDALWFVAKASAYATERQVFGRPIGENQGIQFPIARLTRNSRPPP